jgi:2-polyprenyl-6-methoxyphenol hydroxylase-like FAD-dependent oxidoreductase
VEDLEVLVIGGGIGGLAAALALRTAGVGVRLFEQQTDLRRIRVGGGIHMWANAMQVLRAIGVADHVIERGARIDRTDFINSKGRLLATWRLAEVAAAHGTQDVGIARGELQGLLSDAQEEETVRVGMLCTGFEQDAEGVTARFEDGSEVRGAALVGADGLRSAIRDQVLGPEPPRYAGYAQLQALVDGAAELLPAGVERVVFGGGVRAVLHEAGDGKLFWAAALYGPEGTCPADGAARRDLVLEAFEGWPAPVEEAVSATAPEAIVAFDIYDRPPVRSWSRGRVTLLGDAAHPMTTNLSQGGCQAIEDGLALATALAAHADVADALRAYEQRRIPRTSALVKQSHAVAKVGGFKNPVICAVRDRMTSITLGGPGYRDYKKLADETMAGAAAPA